MTVTADDLNIYRLGAFIAEGMEPEKALALVHWIEQNGPSVEERLATVDRLSASGVDYYVAFTTLFCHPSDHEPYEAIGEEYLETRKEGEFADDPEPQ